MVRKQIDNRIRVLIENGVKLGHRTLFVVLGDKAKDQVVLLHHMLHKAAPKGRPSVLWCYKKELGFSSHRKKRMKQIQKKSKYGSCSTQENDPFELFVSSNKIRFCYYAETHKILGNTYGMCILQDFESLTPNLLARTIETVEGGGLIVILLRTLNSLKQLYNLTMDIHRHFRTEAQQDVVCRFNERFLLSLASCKRCLIIDDQLNILPITSRNVHVTPVDNAVLLSENYGKLIELKAKTKEIAMIGELANCCKTLDQGNALLKFIDIITNKTLRATVSLTAPRGRGKSAVLGLAVAAAVGFGYSIIFVTSPSPENLITFFEFVCKGFDALGYEEHSDYTLSRSTNPEFNKSIIRIEVNRDHRHIIQYIHPTDGDKLSLADLLVIDEAAAIPLTYVKTMLGPYLIFLASTINGYEGTGRSLSLKLLQQLRVQTSEKTLHEITMKESIRYKPGDDVETWLNKLLCLDASEVLPISSGCPAPDVCDLYYINRDTLFSYHPVTEVFLQRLIALYVSSDYKNSPNDLQMMSDAPGHHLFCLLGPVDVNQESLPEILVIVHVCLEGRISENSAEEAFTIGQKKSGDLIPWTISQESGDTNFTSLMGARIIRIATHPDFQKKGYGLRAIELLKQYYEFKFVNIEENEEPKQDKEESEEEEATDLLNENIAPKKCLSPLLLKLSECTPEKLSYLGVSYGLTELLLKFWKRAEFVPLYINQSTNDITGEHSCIMLHVLKFDEPTTNIESWVSINWEEFKWKFLGLLTSSFKNFSTLLALNVLLNNNVKINNTKLTSNQIYMYLPKHCIRKLKNYSDQLIDYHHIQHLLPSLAKMYFLGQFYDVELSDIQSGILLGIGLQGKLVETVAFELDLPVKQLLALLQRLVKKFYKHINSLLEEELLKSLESNTDVSSLTPLAQSLQSELEEAAQAIEQKQKKEMQKLKNENLSQYAIKGSDDDWRKVQSNTSVKSMISIKTGEKRLNTDSKIEGLESKPKVKKIKKKK